MTDSAKIRELRHRVCVRYLICIGLLLSTLLPVLSWFNSPAAIEISDRTTKLTRPLTPDRMYIDYAEAMRRRYWKEGQIDLRSNEWFKHMSPKRDLSVNSEQLPVYSSPWVALSQQYSEEEIRKRLTRDMHMPFTSADNPELAEVVANNLQWYQAICSVDPGLPSLNFTQIHSDGTAMVSGLGDADGEMDMEIGRRFSLLAMYFFGNAQTDQGMSAARTILVAAEREQLIYSFSALCRSFALREMAHDAICVGLLGSSNGSADDIRFALSLPVDSGFRTDMVDRWDIFLRFEQLDLLQEEHRTQCSSSRLVWTGKSWPKLKTQLFWHRVDWNFAMELHNNLVDVLIDGLKIGSYSNRKAWLETKMKTQIEYYDQHNDPSIDSVGSLLFRDMTALAISSSFELYNTAIESSELLCHDLNDRRRTHLTARIAFFRQLHGSFPETLDMVLEIEGLDKPPNDVTIDAFSGKAFVYKRNADGFVLRSVGPNLVDDTEGNVRDGMNCDDTVWQWPIKGRLSHRKAFFMRM